MTGLNPPRNPDPHVPACVMMSGMDAVCPTVLTHGQIRCATAERGVAHVHCVLDHVHLTDREGNILDAPVTI